LVIIPLQIFAKFERKHIIFILVALFAMQAFVAIGSVDMAFLAAWDVSVYLDAIAAVWMIATVAKVRVVGSCVSKKYLQLIRRHTGRGPRAKRNRSIKTSQSKAAHNDDEHRSHFGLAA
jgi:hypothetical protein